MRTASTRRWSSGAAGEPELPEDARHVLLDRPLGDHDETLGDALVRAALGHELEHLALARRQVGERIVAAAPADELRDDGRVERRAALRDPAHGVGELATTSETRSLSR